MSSMAPIPKTKCLPLRNEAGRFIKSFVNHNSPGKSVTMKTITSIKVKGKKFKRRTLGNDTPRIGKKTSVVWHFFKSLPHENGISRAVCLLCKVIFKNPGGSTTGMRGHLDRKHPGVIEKVLAGETFKQEPRQRASLPATTTTKTEYKTERRSGSATPPPPHLSAEYSTVVVGAVGETEIFEQESIVDVDCDHIDQNIASASTTRGKSHILPGPPPKVYSDTEAEEVTRSIVLNIASSMQPFHTLENYHFRKMLYTINNAYMVETGSLQNDSISKPACKAMDDLCNEAKDYMATKMREKYISLSLEIWVKSNCEIYLLITANVISQNWTFENFFLGLRPVQNICLITHPDIVSQKVSQMLPSILEEFEIKQENVVHVLFHSVPFNISSGAVLSKPTWPCVNDTIQRSFELINEFVTQITNCDMLHDTRKIGKQVLSTYKEVKKHPGKLMKAMKCFLESQANADGLPLKLEEIDECAQLHEPLNMIIDALMEDPIIPASTILPLIFLVRSVYESQIANGASTTWSKEQRQEIIQSLNNQFEGYYKINLNSNELGDPMLAVCSFLDPRYKKLKFLSREQRQHVYDTVLELLHEQGRRDKTQNSGTGSIVSVRSENPAYANMNEETTVDISPATDPLNPTTSTPTPQSNQTTSKFYDMMSIVVGRRQVQLPSLEAMEEMTSYWDEPVAAVTMDPWTWWRYNRERFPKLADLARRFMVIRGTASFTKLDFTVAGKRFYNQLDNIEPEYIDKLQFLRRYHNLHFAELAEENGIPNIPIDDHIDIKAEEVENIELVDEAMDS